MSPEALYPTARHDHLGHAGHSVLRDHRLPGPAGERPSQRGLSHDPDLGEPPRRESRHHGVGGGDSPREAIHHHRRRGLHDVDQRARPHQHHDPVQSRVGTSTAPRRTSRRPSPRRSSQLPSGLPTPPTYQKVNPADQPILYLSLSSPTLPLYTVDEYAETLFAQRISTISGVAQVQVFGSQKYAVRIQLDPNALASRGIGIDEVRRRSSGKCKFTTGTLYGPHQAFNVQTTRPAHQTPPPIVLSSSTYRNGSPVRLGDLGRVIDSVQTDKVASWYNGERAVVLAIQRQPGTNTVEVVDAIRKLLPTFRAQIPASVNLNILYDRSVSIRDRFVTSSSRCSSRSAGRSRDLPLPAERLRDDHPEPGPPHVDRGDLRRHVPVSATRWTTSP